VLVTVVVTGIVFVTVIGTVFVTGTITVLVTGTETVLVTGDGGRYISRHSGLTSRRLYTSATRYGCGLVDGGITAAVLGGLLGIMLVVLVILKGVLNWQDEGSMTELGNTG